MKYFSGKVDDRRSPHGERGLKFQRLGGIKPDRGRSPHGERGLKSELAGGGDGPTRSLPSRGAWIEIPIIVHQENTQPGRSPHGERGLKSL